MIKCNVTVCGTVSRQAQMRANKEGTQFASFGINIVIPAKSGIRGTLGKQIEDKTTKSGKSFTVFSAYSSEKDGDNYTYTWVRFMQFDKRKEAWMQPKAGINAKGDRLDLTCRISECSLWEKNSNTYQH